MADKPSAEKDKVSLVDTIRLEMSAGVQRLAEPSRPGESVKSCVRRVASKTGLPFGQVRRLWYGEWRRVPADIARIIERKIAEHEAETDRIAAARAEKYLALTRHTMGAESAPAHVPERGRVSDGDSREA